MGKKTALIISLLALILPINSWATWQVAGHQKKYVDDDGNKHVIIVSDAPKQYQVDPQVTLTTQKGLLINTIYDYAQNHNWGLLWLAKRSYPLKLSTKFEGPNMQTVLQRLIQHYPLKVHLDKDQKLILVGHDTAS